MQVLAQVAQAAPQGRAVPSDLPQLLRQLLRLLLHPQRLPSHRRPRALGTRPRQPPRAPQLLLQEGWERGGHAQAEGPSAAFP